MIVVPHSTGDHCSRQMILSFLFTRKNPLKLSKKEGNSLSQPLFGGKLVKTPLFLDFGM